MAHKTPSHDTNILPKVLVFDKTAFVKFNFERNIDETDLK